MYRKGQAIIKTILAAGLIVSVMGGTQIKAQAVSVDQIYADAYHATVRAASINTQKSINDARSAIELLKNTSASWAIGEFSKQVDKVQHPFLVKIVDSITKAQQSVSQTDINAARATIDPDLPQVWKNSYSSALDIVQQSIMKELIDSYNSAAITDDQGAKDSVNALLQELEQAVDPSIGAWAKEFTKPMLSVWSDSEIINIDNNMTDVYSNMNTYTKLPLNNVNAITYAYEDNNKAIKLITNIDNNVYQEFYYSNNQYVNYIGEISGDANTQYINEIYLKDNNLVKWVSIVLTNGETTSINIYDENNLPDSMKTQLDSYKQNAGKLLTDAIALGQ